MAAFGLSIDITTARPIMRCDDGVFSESKSYLERNDIIIYYIIKDEERSLPPRQRSANNLIYIDDTGLKYMITLYNIR